MSEPIWIRCEGSGCPTHNQGFERGTRFPGRGMCSMCGAPVPLAGDEMAVTHNRDDILARLERGDYNKEGEL